MKSNKLNSERSKARKLLLFGRRGGAGVVATGGTVQDVTIDGTTYRVHTFNTSGDLVVTQGGNIQYLVVAGGGAGGNNRGGGGGAGGLLEGTLNIENGSHLVTIGSGGVSSNGSNSSLLSIEAIGGGQGGSRPDIAPTIGGSGGGSQGNEGNAGAAGIEGQGHKGGDSPSDSTSGGGGGAGGQGGGEDGIGTLKGPGKTVNITGTPTLFCEGGEGVYEDTPVLDATPNTGNGGRGSHPPGVGRSKGGSGIVIVRYPI